MILDELCERQILLDLLKTIIPPKYEIFVQKSSPGVFCFNIHIVDHLFMFIDFLPTNVDVAFLDPSNPDPLGYTHIYLQVSDPEFNNKIIEICKTQEDLLGEK